MCLETHSDHHIVKQEINMLVSEYIWFKELVYNLHILNVNVAINLL